MPPPKYYIVYTRNVLPQTNVASLVQVVNMEFKSANIKAGGCEPDQPHLAV